VYKRTTAPPHSEPTTGGTILHCKNSAFITSYQLLKAEGRFLDSKKRDKYGPRGF
jgi:hypothetical protein